MKKTNKLLAILVTALLLSLPLAGCAGGGAGASGSAGGEGATINVVSNKGEISGPFQEAVDSYMQANPDITINVEFVQGDDYKPSLKAKLLSAGAPTLFILDGPADFKDYSEFMEDLSDQPWVENVVDGLLEDTKLEDKVVGVPVAVEGYGIVYNKDILAAAGIDAASINTFAALEQAVQTLDAKIAAGELAEQFPLLEAPMEYAGKETWVLGLHTLGVGLGEELNGATGAANAASIEMTHAQPLQQLFDLLTTHTPAGEDRALLTAVDYSTQLGGSLGIEKVAMTQQGNWISPEMMNVAPDVLEKLDFLPIPLPGVREDAICAGVPTYWCVNAKADDADKTAAKAFINWLYQSDEGKKIVVEEFSFVPAFSNYEGITLSDPLGAAVQRYLDEGRAMTFAFPGYPSGFQQKAGASMQSYLSGQMTWEECVEALKADWASFK